jgi:hypothetical protein
MINRQQLQEFLEKVVEIEIDGVKPYPIGPSNIELLLMMAGEPSCKQDVQDVLISNLIMLFPDSDTPAVQHFVLLLLDECFA